ncbi:MAG: sugar O-acetyltransferase [Oenococcus sp.]|uniref:sugar O-acetyltransferase n=1 Tax=Oenococcus sp. TaxID=1979414 RepID=UPI0039EC379E
MDDISRREQGLPYHYDNPAFMGQQSDYLELLFDFNQTRPNDTDKQNQLLKAMFAGIGSGCHIAAPLHSSWGCHHVHFGTGVYCNFNLTLLDDASITVGDDCMFGPNVVLAAVGHPILPVLREHHYVYNIPIKIGSNVWIGANVTVLPGVTIGDNTVIGAGSVVSNDIPSGVVAVGAPCRVARKIGKKDEEYYFKNKKLDVWE